MFLHVSACLFSRPCYVAYSKHVFSHRKWMKMVYAGGSSRHGYILVGALWSFEIF
jgi:hypothetical protein